MSMLFNEPYDGRDTSMGQQVQQALSAVVSQGRRVSKGLKAAHDLSGEDAGRLTYHALLKDLAGIVGLNLPFTVPVLDEYSDSVSALDLSDMTRAVLEDANLLDAFYEGLVSTPYRKRHGQFRCCPVLNECVVCIGNRNRAEGFDVEGVADIR